MQKTTTCGQNVFSKDIRRSLAFSRDLKLRIPASSSRVGASNAAFIDRIPAKTNNKPFASYL
jgi:hypothetical protein